MQGCRSLGQWEGAKEMKVTLMGILAFLAVAVFLVFAGYELHRTMDAKAHPKDEKPGNPSVNP